MNELTTRTAAKRMVNISTTVWNNRSYTLQQGLNVGKRFRNPNYPSVAPKRDYVPTRSSVKPPFYAEIEAASQWPHDSEAWDAFVRDVVHMPETMKPAVQEAIRQQRWKIAPNPLAAIRTGAHQEARRMGLL